MDFRLVSEFAPKGDQEQAIAKLVKSIESGNRHQTLRGVTGSGKTFTMANVINQIQKPTLIMSHNKTLAAQLYSEFKEYFPSNSVEYFVSYYDYYQPEAYLPRSDTYIEKDSSINEEIERLRLSTMGSLITRDDVIVSKAYQVVGIGNAVSDVIATSGDEFLTEHGIEKGIISFERGHFRVRGDVVEVRPAYLEETAIRIEFFGDEIDRITSIDTRSGHVIDEVTHYVFYPAKQFVSSKEKLKGAMVAIRQELDDRIAWFEKNGKLIEAQRIRMRTEYDLEMMQEMGFCQGIENYSRHITGRKPGERPYTLLDFFPDDYLLLADESHATLPQVRGMFEGDKSRKSVLVDHGFRLPSAMDNRPLRFDEYMKMTKRRLYVSATPGPFEIVNSRPDNPKFIPIKSRNESDFDPTFFKRLTIKASGASEKPEDFDISRSGGQLIVEQIIRPTGLLDPILTMRPLKSQIDETIELCQQRVEKDERVLVTTLTKKMAEDLTEYLQGVDLKVRYIHADVDAIERVEILRALRAAEFDILVGINLLREGLDLPEVSLVCILDADKEGFLRSERSLIQTMGRAARNINGSVLFCDIVTDSIQCLLDVTEYRRRIQREHNEEHGITPKSVKRAVQKSLHDRGASHQAAKEVNTSLVAEDEMIFNAVEVIREMEDEMQKASAKLEFEKAAHLRDQIKELKQRAGIEAPPPNRKAKVKYNLARKIENDD